MDDNQLPATPLRHRPSSSHSSKRTDKPFAPQPTLSQWQEEETPFVEEWPVAGPSYSSVPKPQCIEEPQSLLTSEPLNRSMTSTSLGKRRTRSSSLPSSIPHHQAKRHRRHDPATTSEAWCFRYKGSKREMSKLERAEIAARSLRKELERVRSSTIVASRLPPVNVATLKSLDANEILKNPQLRHDLLFDALAFRPVCANEENAISADLYWETLRDELMTGCRCARWKVVDGQRVKETFCVCGGWKKSVSEQEWWTWQSKRWNSRIPDMVKTLREVLLSLMGSTTPCPNHFAHSFSREALEAHEATCPTVTHALVPELYLALDPEFITVQLRRGVFGRGIFQMLGEAMKVHCAPVRDAMVDDMVATAMVDVTSALRKCFDCVEVMKLDIANHQVHALRPYLWRAAPSHELAAFRSMLASSKTSMDSSITKQWIRDASTRVLKTLDPAKRNIIMARKDQLAVRATIEGFMEVVCGEWCHVWPPVPQRRAATSMPVTERPSIRVRMPESFKMDSQRMKNFNADIIEITTMYLILRFVHATAKMYVSSIDLGSARADIDEAFSVGASPLKSSPGPEPSDLSIRLTARIIAADGVSRGIERTDMTRVNLIARSIDSFCHNYLKPDSSVYLDALKDVRQAITAALTNTLLEEEQPAKHGSGKRESEEGAKPANEALQAMSTVLRDLIEKMARIVSFNIKTYAETYREKGMMVGS